VERNDSVNYLERNTYCFLNKVAFVTAAGSGIGAAGAHAMAREGAHVVVTGRDVQSAKAVAEAINIAGYAAEALQLDVTDDQAAYGSN
jgi:NADP-dependent 3-hydroxy acid dehydrogenase YdfG